MTNKEKYELFCNNTYVPIYSKPWWLDAICGERNWDVWLYEKGEDILAAMPYYIESRNGFKYITKAPLTQNNGIIFKQYSHNICKNSSNQRFEEEVINQACIFIDQLSVDVYEQQYQYSFSYFLPFFWNRYTIIPRVTYVIENTQDIDAVWNNISSKYRNKIRKGMGNSRIIEDIDKDRFWKEHEKVFLRQNLPCPFSYELWCRLYLACKNNNAGKVMCSITEQGDIASVLFLVWDEKSAYQILGGNIPGYETMDTYSSLIWKAIQFASERCIKYDFEGSVIKRISKSFREYGGIPKEYFRIRKVFNPLIFQKEFNDQKRSLFGVSD